MTKDIQGRVAIVDMRKWDDSPGVDQGHVLSQVMFRASLPPVTKEKLDASRGDIIKMMLDKIHSDQEIELFGETVSRVPWW